MFWSARAVAARLRRDAVAVWQNIFTVIPTTEAVLSRGMDLAADHRLAIWDAVILSAAGCRLLLSEDMHDGFTWGGVTIVNPFAPSPNKLLELAAPVSTLI